jgi:hypothetical protein
MRLLTTIAVAGMALGAAIASANQLSTGTAVEDLRQPAYAWTRLSPTAERHAPTIINEPAGGPRVSILEDGSRIFEDGTYRPPGVMPPMKP